MKKKIKYRNSYITFETGLTSTVVKDDSTVDTEGYVMIRDIHIAREDMYTERAIRLLGRVLQNIFAEGELFIRYYMKRTDQEYMDYIFSLISGAGF